MTNLVTLATLLSVFIWTGTFTQSVISTTTGEQGVGRDHCYSDDIDCKNGVSNKHRGILLIGSTGNGKSTLGNFLLDHSKEGMLGEKQVFKRARDNKAETLFVKHVSRDVRYKGGDKSLPITVIDTPGLNEDDSQDLKHVIQIISTLRRASETEVFACVFVVKFDSRIDAQYKATVRYYRQLFPQLFEKNVIIVMTMFDLNEQAEQDRKERGIDMDRIKDNILREIIDSGNLHFQPMIFMLNGLPLTDEGIASDLKQRDDILDYVSTLTPISTSRLRIAKTAKILAEDKIEISKLKGENEGDNSRLLELNDLTENDLEEIELNKIRVAELVSKVSDKRNDLKVKDSSDNVTAASRSFSTEWRFFRSLSEDFDLSAPYKVTNVNTWTNGNCRWSKFERYHNGVKGTLEGDFMKGLYAELRLETMMYIKYAEEIKRLNTEIGHIEELLSAANKALMKAKRSRERNQADIESIKAKIEERHERIEVYSRMHMTIDEACKRLNEVFGESSSVCEPQ